MLIGLLRHGEVEGGTRFRGHTDDPLTCAGFAQMHTATQTGPCWTRVISSPLRRCAEFAEVFAQQRGLPLCFDSRLKELHFGTWEGRSPLEVSSEAPDALARFWDDPLGCPPPQGESLAQLQERVLAAWHGIAAVSAGHAVLLVTHGGVIRVLLCHVLQKPLTHLLSFEVPHGALYGVHLAANGTMAMIAPRGMP